MDEPRQAHVAELDALRGIAIFGVVMTHVVNSLALLGNDLPGTNLDLTQFFNTGGLGVQLFFLLSGFLLTTTESRRYAAGRGSVWAYARRRFLRLAPAYYLALACALVWNLWQGIYHPAINRDLDLLIYLTFLHGLTIGTHSNLDPAYWSLTCEVVFYVTLPFLLLYVRRLRIRVGLYALSLLLAGVLYYWYAASTDLELRFYLLFHPLVHLHLFLAGSLLATLAERKARGTLPRLPAIRGDALLLLALFYVTFNAYINRPQPWAIAWSRLGGEMFVAVGFAAYVAGSPILRRILALPGLEALGRISYSVFLFHGLLMGLAEHAGSVRLVHSWANAGVPHIVLFGLYLAATLLVSIAVCSCSYRWIELPGMRGFRRRPVPAALAVSG
jgi:peptidoglycan/LPS O-acetylase OafA/YrhL